MDNPQNYHPWPTISQIAYMPKAVQNRTKANEPKASTFCHGFNLFSIAAVPFPATRFITLAGFA
jgi:hypothetical protein